MISRFAELFLFGVAPLLIGLALVPTISLAAQTTIKGDILYRERIALPPNAVATVKLVDVSLADAPAKVVAEQTIDPAGQVPIPFSLTFDAAGIQSGQTHALQARIMVGGTLWFITDTRHAIDPDAGSRPQTLVLKMVRHSHAPSDTAIFDRTWLAEDIEERGVIDNARSTFQIGRDGKVAGLGACNNYFATASMEGTAIEIGIIGSTFKLCPPVIMDLEKRFFAALGKAKSFRLDDTGKLFLVDASGQALLRFAPSD